MLHLVHRVAISIKLRPVKLYQDVSENLPQKELTYTSSDPINMSGSSSIFDPRVQCTRKNQLQIVMSPHRVG